MDVLSWDIVIPSVEAVDNILSPMLLLLLIVFVLVYIWAGLEEDWSSSEYKIQGAVRASYAEFSTWSSSLDKDKTIVLYCA